MQTYRIEDKQLAEAVKQLKLANAMLAAMKKQADNAKETIGNRLKELRGVELSTLPIGEMVNIDGLLIIEIGKQNRFDSATFQANQPGLYQSYLKDFPTMKFKALI